MDIKELNPNAFADMFSEPAGTPSKQAGVSFGMAEQEQDLFNIGLETANLQEGTAAVPSTTLTETTTQAPEQSTDNQDPVVIDPAKPTPEVDILGDGKGKQVEPPKTDELKGLSDYFQQRMKEGKFIAVNDVDDKGNKVPFIPKTAEEFDEVIEMQVNWKIDQAKKDLDQQWYNSKSPAWKAVSQYAEIVDDPTKLIPFLEGVKTIQSVAALDENEIDDAEQIVRTRLEQGGDPEEVITAQIESLKTTDKLISTAKSIKPIMIQQEQQSLAMQVQEERRIRQENLTRISAIREGTIKAIEQPLFGKQKLKQDEKMAIYELISEPQEESGGYPIYTAIDNLYDNGDFETLRQVALLLSKKDAFYGYLGTDVANKTAIGLQRKLQLATDSRSSSGNDFDEQKVPAVTRQYNKQVRFGANDK